MVPDDIDWTVFDRFSEPTLTCRCGVTYRSHAKSMRKEGYGIVARKPCPGCGRWNDIIGIRGDPEEFTIRGR